MPGFESFSPALIAWVIAVMAVAGLVHGALGLGFPIVATPLIALVTDMRSAIILVLLPCIAVVVASIVKGRGVRAILAEFWPMPIYTFVGASLGTRLFIAHPGAPFTLLLAFLIVVYLNLDRLGKTEWPLVSRRRRLFGALFGLIAGMSEGTANASAPPLVVYYMALALPPTALVQGLNICFITGKATQFATLAAAGGVTATQWLITLPLAVIAVTSLLWGARIRGEVDAAIYRSWLKRALFAIALIMLAQYGYANWIKG